MKFNWTDLHINISSIGECGEQIFYKITHIPTGKYVEHECSHKRTYFREKQELVEKLKEMIEGNE